MYQIAGLKNMKTFNHRITTVDIDALPGTLYLHDVSDYIGIQVLSPTALPLFYYNQIYHSLKCLGAENYSISQDGCTYEITIRNDLFWSDGTKVTAEDYVRGFFAIINSKHNIYRILLKDIVNYGKFIKDKNENNIGIEVVGRKIIFRLVHPNNLFIIFLSTINFSPKHHSEVMLAAGAYNIETVTENGIILSRNPFFTLDKSNPNIEVDYIHYIKPASRYESLQQYEQKQLDITCNTMFPYEQLSKFKERKDFYQEPSNIFMILRKEKKCNPILEEKVFRQAILFSLNRANLCANFHYALTPMTDFFFDSNMNQNISSPLVDNLYNSELAADLFHLLFSMYNIKDVRLKVAFDDYFPNKEVLELVSIELKSYNIYLELIQDNFLTPSKSADLRLHLLTSPVYHPFPIYLKEAYDHDFMKNDTWKTYIALLESYHKCNDDDKKKQILEVINTTLISEAFIIPLFKMQSLYLKRDGLENFKFVPGKIWIKEER